MAHSSARKERVALLLASGKTPKAAAAAAEVSRRVVFAWLRKPDFKARVQELQTAMFTRAVARLTALCGRAAARLGRLLASEREAVALGACRAVLDRAADLGRLAALEQRIAELEGNHHAGPGHAFASGGSNGAARDGR
jgi:hypothetical protein